MRNEDVLGDPEPVSLFLAHGEMTLHGKVDSMEEATLSQGVHDGQKDEDEKTVRRKKYS
jgi:hypothetical protein